MGAERVILFVVAACILARVRGMRFACLARDWSLLPLAAVELFFWTAQICAWNEVYIFIRWASAIQTAYLLALLFPIFRHRLYREACAGAAMTVFGTMLNRWVMSVNGGKMPVYPTLSRWTGYYRDGAMAAAGDGLHVLMDGSTKLKLLGDWIDVGFSIMSIGDVLIHGFVFWIVYRTICAWNRGKAV